MRRYCSKKIAYLDNFGSQSSYLLVAGSCLLLKVSPRSNKSIRLLWGIMFENTKRCRQNVGSKLNSDNAYTKLKFENAPKSYKDCPNREKFQNGNVVPDAKQNLIKPSPQRIYMQSLVRELQQSLCAIVDHSQITCDGSPKEFAPTGSMIHLVKCFQHEK